MGSRDGGGGNDRIDAGFSISEPTAKVLTDFQEVIKKAMKGAILAVAHNNRDAAEAVIKMKDEIQALADSAAEHQAGRLVAEEPNRIAAYTTEIDIIEKFHHDDIIQHCLHWNGYGAEHRQAGTKVEIAGIDQGYHTFGLLWTALQAVVAFVVILIDRAERATLARYRNDGAWSEGRC